MHKNVLPFIILDGPLSLAGDSNMASARVSLILSSSSSLPLGLVTVDSAQLLYTSHRLGDWSKLPKFIEKKNGHNFNGLYWGQ